MSDPMLTASGASNGFWGTVGSAAKDLGSQFLGGFVEGTSGVVRNAGSQLPVWAADQLGVSGSVSPQPGVSSPIDTSLGNIGVERLWDDVQVTEAGPLQGLDSKTALAIGGIVLAAVLLFKFKIL